MPLALFIGNKRINTYKDPQTCVTIVSPDSTLPPTRLTIRHLNQFHGNIIWEVLHQGDSPTWAPFGPEVIPPFTVSTWDNQGPDATLEPVPFLLLPNPNPYLAVLFDGTQRYAISINDDETDTLFEFPIPSKNDQDPPLTRFKEFELRPTFGFSVVTGDGDELFDWDLGSDADPNEQEVIDIVTPSHLGLSNMRRGN